MKDVLLILIKTRYDKDELMFEKLKALEGAFGDIHWNVFIADGDKIPNITDCLNQGIRVAIDNDFEYVHWMHLDFTYDDPNWFPTLRKILIEQPDILKICASNSRDRVYPFRIGHEQSWLMRTSDFGKYPFLFFNSEFIGCGGCEDYYLHYNILGRGYFVAITPECTVFHRGAQTRSQYDSNPAQFHNHSVFAKLTGLGGLVEVHQKEYFGCLLPPEEKSRRISQLPDNLQKLVL